MWTGALVATKECFYRLTFFPDKAPVSKGLMGSMFLTCTAMNMPLLAHMRKYLVCKLPDIFKEGEVRFIELVMFTFFYA
jgi:hypothetical protein